MWGDMRVVSTFALCAALFVSCTPVDEACGPSNCNGCCDAVGECQRGVMNSACGGGGQLCQACPSGHCSLGTCVNVPTCTPRTCAAAGKNCGTIDDGCGRPLSCGTCGDGETCGAGGVNVCGVGTCTTKTCAEQSAACGNVSDGCSELLSCGSCDGGLTCVSNQCACVAATCSSLGKNCGSVDDGCGGALNCGTCSQGTCGGGGNANVCGSGNCTPATCSSLGKDCGTPSDGCGGILTCGTCSLGTCGGGGTTNVCGAVCSVSCPTGYACDAYGQCAGGTPTNLTFNVATLEISGKVTTNGAAPVDSGDCNGTYYYRGYVRLTETTHGYSFAFPLQGCSGDATFSGTIFPGTYRVTVEGGYSDLPSGTYVANAALPINASTNTLAFNVASFAVSGKVTHNGAAPVDSGDCNGTYYYRGYVRLTETTNGYSFTFPLQDCSGDATFSGIVFPGTYRVTVNGSYSDLPSTTSVVLPSLVVN